MSASLPSVAPTVLRYAAFADPANVASIANADATTMTGAGGSTVGGNPAGIVLDAVGLTDTDMQRVAAEVGYAETAFVVNAGTSNEDINPNRFTLRYFSPIAEVPFCGHATVATAVALAERTSTSTSTSTSHDTANFTFDTSVGEVTIATTRTADGITAAFTSVEPEVRPIDPAVLRHLLSLVGLTEADLDAR
jgi:PhzF family phenazine biosynthesis protein